MKTYRRKGIVKAKLFESGDEVGFTSVNDRTLPYILKPDGYKSSSPWGQSYLCVDEAGNKFLLEKEFFERNYEEIPE